MNFDEIFNLFQKDIESVKDTNTLNEVKIKYMGRKGIINQAFKMLNNLPKKDKEDKGKFLNNIKNKIALYLNEQESLYIKPNNNNKKIIDITLPGFGYATGSKHIITQMILEIENFFIHYGFNIVSGKELDTTYYNFHALNMPKEHPSRSSQETFYVSEDIVLRTHTSNMQIHIMKETKPPLKIISHGKVYRRDSDASHTPMFHQVEGFIIDKNVSLANLKFLLFNFLKVIFNKNIKINFRSSYFPFTEPSMEIDIECVNCSGQKCSLCKYSGWLEVLGCGMIHENVLKNCSINTKIYQGIAFGMGIERLTMIKYQINDLRIYFENNLDFLKQF